MASDPDYVRRLLDETREEVSRADTKASIVLAGASVVVGILLTGLVTGDIAVQGQPWFVVVLAWISGALLVGGLAFVGWAVYPQTGSPDSGRARWFAEIVKHRDDAALAEAVAVDQGDGNRDLHQTRELAGIVWRKYQRTKIGMRLLALGLGAVLAALLSEGG